MKILISEKLSQHRFKTPEGYLICTDAILARTGKQTYRRSEVFGDSCKDAEQEVEVDRPEKEVFSESTLASFENKPVTVEHPDVDVNSENYKDYAVGFTRDIHRGDCNGEPVILGTLVITDAQTIEEIENGEHTELSCGYDCDIVDSENPRQTNIRGNHVALCERGRAGIARIVDAKPDAGAKLYGNNYNWELEGKAKSKEDALRKFKAKYPECYNTWGGELEWMMQNNKDYESERGEWGLHFDYDEYDGHFYIAVVEDKKRYNDSKIKDAGIRFIGVVVEFVEGRHTNVPKNPVSIEKMNQWLKSEDYKVYLQYPKGGYDKCWIDFIFQDDQTKKEYRIHGARVDLGDASRYNDPSAVTITNNDVLYAAKQAQKLASQNDSISDSESGCNDSIHDDSREKIAIFMNGKFLEYSPSRESAEQRIARYKREDRYEHEVEKYPIPNGGYPVYEIRAVKDSTSALDSLHRYEVQVGDTIHWVYASSIIDAVKIVNNRK